jgi:hypothetical protein
MNPPHKRKIHPIQRLLLLDVLSDRETRPILLYALGVIAIAATLYHWLEGWSWLDSVYFLVITMTTIGYGDLTPTQPGTKLLTIFVALNGIVLLLTLFDTIRRVRGWGAPHEEDEKADQDE